MKKSRFTNEQFALSLRQVVTGVSDEEVCRKIDANQQTFYRWKKKFVSNVEPPFCAFRTTPAHRLALNSARLPTPSMATRN